MTLPLILFYFMIFAFLGWILEVAFAAVKSGRFVNRGFCNGPVCPSYGAGVAVIYAALGALRDKWILLFLASVLVTSAIELVTGFLMDKLFHTKWWDYSGKKFNIGGYICLRFSLIWGLLCMGVVKLLFPLFDGLYALIGEHIVFLIEIVFFAVLLVDFAVSVASVIGLNRRLGALDKIAEELHRGSDSLGGHVYRGTVAVEEQYTKLATKAQRMARRILDAFPTMSSGKHNEQLTALRERLAAWRKAKKEQKAEKKANGDPQV
ncbi:MAG TPA: hypothetical protein DDY70_03240 [Clostridiales bacterium]|nr:hypothetical protein [Clostridiales bacterium]